MCMFAVRGKYWARLHRWMHPNLKKAVMDYWDSWRDQKEIGEKFIEYYWSLQQIKGKRFHSWFRFLNRLAMQDENPAWPFFIGTEQGQV